MSTEDTATADIPATSSGDAAPAINDASSTGAGETPQDNGEAITSAPEQHEPKEEAAPGAPRDEPHTDGLVDHAHPEQTNLPGTPGANPAMQTMEYREPTEREMEDDARLAEQLLKTDPTSYACHIALAKCLDTTPQVVAAYPDECALRFLTERQGERGQGSVGKQPDGQGETPAAKDGTAPDGGAANDPAPRTYTMKKGDTLWGISQATGIPLEKIQAANPQITDPTKIPIGAVVNVPQAEEGSAKAAEAPVGAREGTPPQEREDSDMPDSTESSPETSQTFNGRPQHIEDSHPSDALSIAERVISALVGEAHASELQSGQRQGRTTANPAADENRQSETFASWLRAPAGSYPWADKPLLTIKGDSLPKVSERTGIPVKTLESTNPKFKGKKVIPAGSKINLPQLSNMDVLALGPESAGMLSYPNVKPQVVDARDGENLFSVSQRTGLPIELLMHVNGIDDPEHYHFKAGDVVRLPQQSPVEKLREWYDDWRHPEKAIDLNAAIRQLQNQALDHFSKKCAHFVFAAIAAGKHKKLDDIPHPASAKDAGKDLEALGFKKWTDTLDGYVPRKGDVVVIQAIPGTDWTDGHTAMFDGKHWISDKVQDGKSGMWGNLVFPANKAAYAIYRP